jgi:hypothetical protein
MADNSELGSLFKSYLNQGQYGLDKFAEQVTPFIQRRVRDTAFSRLLIENKPISADKLIPEENTENYYTLIELEPDSIATSVTGRADAMKSWFRGKKAKITFQIISTKEMEKSVEELAYYSYPITDIMEKNGVRDIQEQEDFAFMNKIHGGLYHSTLEKYNTLVADGFMVTTANFASEAELYTYLFTQVKAPAWPVAGYSASAVRYANYEQSSIILTDDSRFSRLVIPDLIKSPLFKEIMPKVFLMTEVTFADRFAWTLNETGLETTDTITKDGYTYRKVGGFDIITTIRSRKDIVPPKVVYVFPEQNFLGKFLTLSPIRYEIEKVKGKISFRAWESIGVGIINARGVAALVLLGGSLPLRVALQDPTGAVVAAKSGRLWITNDPSIAAASLPAVEVGA